MSTAPSPKNILLFGGTGLIGRYILDALIGSKYAFGTLGIFTSATTLKNKAEVIAEIKGKGVQVVVGDVTREEDVLEAFKGYDTIISALGRTALLSQIPLIRLAEASPSIHTFYPSEYGTDIEHSPSSATEKPHQHKLAVRKFVAENVKRLRITYLVTGPYSDLYLSKNNAEGGVGGTFDVEGKRAVLLGTGEENIAFTSMRDVGVLLVAALKTPAETSPRILKVNSFTATGKQILAEFERQTGAKWDVEYTPVEKLGDRKSVV